MPSVKTILNIKAPASPLILSDQPDFEENEIDVSLVINYGISLMLAGTLGTGTMRALANLVGMPLWQFEHTCRQGVQGLRQDAAIMAKLDIAKLTRNLTRKAASLPDKSLINIIERKQDTVDARARESGAIAQSHIELKPPMRTDKKGHEK